MAWRHQQTGVFMPKKKGDQVANAAAVGDAAPQGNTASQEMLFESNAFQQIPAGVRQIIFKIDDAGDSQSASIGVAVFEKLSADSQWVVLAKQEIDNLAATPEESFLAIAPKPNANYAITFAGEMHALSLSKDPLKLKLLISGEGVGSPIEDFKGSRTVTGRFCAIRGRALLKA